MRRRFGLTVAAAGLALAGCATAVTAPTEAQAAAEPAPVWQAAPVSRVTIRRGSTVPVAGMPANNVAANTGAWLVRR